MGNGVSPIPFSTLARLIEREVSLESAETEGKVCLAILICLEGITTLFSLPCYCLPFDNFTVH